MNIPRTLLCTLFVLAFSGSGHAGELITSPAVCSSTGKSLLCQAVNVGAKDLAVRIQLFSSDLPGDCALAVCRFELAVEEEVTLAPGEVGAAETVDGCVGNRLHYCEFTFGGSKSNVRANAMIIDSFLQPTTTEVVIPAN